MKNKFALAFIAVITLVSASFAEPVYKDVAEGVTLYQEFVEGHLITAAIVDLNVPGVSIRSELAGGTVGGGDKNGRETITGMVKRTGAVVGLKLAPFAVLTTALVSFGLDCEIEIEKEDGTVINLNRTPVGMRLEEIKENAIDKTKEIIDKVKGMSGSPAGYTDTNYTADAAEPVDAAEPDDAQ